MSAELPKPMVPIGERPILWHIMNTYAKFGISDFVLALGYRGWAIKEFFLNYALHGSDLSVNLGDGGRVTLHESVQEGWNVTLVETGLQTQTGGRLGRLRRYLEHEDRFCVTYGDGVAAIDIGSLLAFHANHGKVATLTGVRPPGRFGVMRTREVGGVMNVEEFAEKPQTTEGWINGGYFVFDQRIWSYLSEDEGLVLEREPMMRLAGDGELVMYQHDGFWQPMDTYREWRLLSDLWESGSAPW